MNKFSRSFFFALSVFLSLPVFSVEAGKGGPCFRELRRNYWVAQSQQNARLVKEIKFREENLRPHEMESGFWGRYGMPPSAKTIKAGDRIFRHYTTAENVKLILEGQKLKSAFVYYEEVSPGLRYVYFDLTGIFATSAKATRTSVGVGEGSRESKRHYVDFRLPPETALVQLPKDIYLVPGPKGYPAEFWAELKKYKADPTGYKNDFYRMKIEEYQKAGERSPMQIGIEIIGDGIDTRPD